MQLQENKLMIMVYFSAATFFHISLQFQNLAFVYIQLNKIGACS